MNEMMLDLETLSHEQKELLAEDCEDFLLHRNIPLRSHSYDNIINQALREGYQLSKFDRSGPPKPPDNYPMFP
jgi:hypothetical protein